MAVFPLPLRRRRRVWSVVSLCASFTLSLELWALLCNHTSESTSSRARVAHCPFEPNGFENNVIPGSPRIPGKDLAGNWPVSGSPVLFMVTSAPEHPEWRFLWRENMFPRMKQYNIDGFFFIDDHLKTPEVEEEAARYKDIIFTHTWPNITSPWLMRFYLRHAAAVEWGMNQSKGYEWFVRPDIDSYYCFRHLRLGFNILDQSVTAAQPGLVWGHYSNDQINSTPPGSTWDVHCAHNRAAIVQLQGPHQAIIPEWAAKLRVHEAAHPKTKAVHDYRWAWGLFGVAANEIWAKGFLDARKYLDGHKRDNCFCANWLAIHLGAGQEMKNLLNVTFPRLRQLEDELASEYSDIMFDQPIPL